MTRTPRAARSALYYVFVGGLALLYLVPLLWILSVSFRTNDHLFDRDQWIPHPITFSHYTSGLTDLLPNLGRIAFNTSRIAILGTIGQLLSCSMAGYALARFRFPGRIVILFVLLATLMVPTHATLVPIYVLFRELGWLNTPLPFIVPAFFGNAFGTFLFRQFFTAIPREIEDAARIDGASWFRIFWSIAIPLSKPVFMAYGVITFVTAWNGFFLPTIFLQKPDQWVLTQALRSMIGRTDSQWGEVMALVVLMSLPALVIFIIAQRYVKEGITYSAFK